MIFHRKPQFEHKTLALTLALVVVLCFGNSVEFLRAQDAPSYSSTPSNGAAPEENVDCIADLTGFIAQSSQDYRLWVEDHFNNKSSSSSLLDDAFARYGEYRRVLYDRYNQYGPAQNALQFTEGLEPGACRALVEDELDNARRILEQKALTTSTVKKTTALISKYQEINGQLRNLYQSFITMKKHLDTFADKLPCYIRRGCNK